MIQPDPSREWSRTLALAVAALALSLTAASQAHAVCGDQIIDVGEDCDDGNTAGGDCCSVSCQYEAAGGPCNDDGNPCTDDECDGNGNCFHLNNTAPCSDSDPCTVGTVCGTGVCGVAEPEACIDHYMCYRVRSTEPRTSHDVSITDRVGSNAATVTKPKLLCPPASKNNSAILDSALHEEGYRMRTAGRSQREARVRDQFGSLGLDLLRRDLLFVPTAKGLGAPPPGPPAAGAADHYACWKAEVNRAAPQFLDGLQVTVADQFEDRLYDLKSPRHLCSPVDKNGEPIVHGNAHLMCYQARRVRGEPNHAPLVGVIHTDNQFGTGRLDTRKESELCVPATIDGCPLPRCLSFPTQRPDCHYDPVVTNNTYPFCSGPKILVNRTHLNFHQITPESTANPGRYWGFAKLLTRHGYDVRDSETPFTTLLPTTDAEIIVTANARAPGGPTAEAYPTADIDALASWVSAGGSLLLIIDHRPYERAGAMLAAFGLDRLFNGSAPRHTFTRGAGTLNGSSFFANGRDTVEMIDEVSTFTGTAFSISATPPAQASFEPVLTFPAGVMGKRDNLDIDLGGYLQGVAIRFGLGRVFVAAEAGALTAQTAFGMQDTPGNEQYLLNIIHWLDT